MLADLPVRIRVAAHPFLRAVDDSLRARATLPPTPFPWTLQNRHFPARLRVHTCCPTIRRNRA